MGRTAIIALAITYTRRTNKITSAAKYVITIRAISPKLVKYSAAI
jgi:hypothetical protein